MRIALLGPIKHWWDVWGSPEHLQYMAHRTRLQDQLVAAGHLVYSPHDAWRGQWDEIAQVVNDSAITICDVIINMRMPGIPSDGLDAELVLCRRLNKRVYCVPPGSNLPSSLLREVIPTLV